MIDVTRILSVVVSLRSQESKCEMRNSGVKEMWRRIAFGWKYMTFEIVIYFEFKSSKVFKLNESNPRSRRSG